MNETYGREDQIFARALSMPAGERQHFLENECVGDGDLRRRIEALLVADESVRRFISGHPSQPADTAFEGIHSAPPVSESEGDLIGRYKLLQKLGEGGGGVVWMAEQEEPVRRRVALKIIKLGMDTKEVIARFEAERQALAMLDHTNIAKIFDAGATQEGRPFFVMELIRGIRITDFCDQYNQSTEQRLELFIKVCNAVQHAHQKGIIHRDLKPSNILVTLGDGVPAPKVIDFGVAKATDGRLTDRTLFTAFEQFIGTPTYMSPEQAELSGLDVDTRSDIYSLGVVLYELLTGHPPFDPKTLIRSGLDEVRRIIREVEPPSPSTSLSTLTNADCAQMARFRRTDPAKLVLMLRGDLDWIVMRCLEKNRTRRYETANALAADIARHLHHEPILARPPSRMYRFGKAVRRNRLAFAATAAVALALIAGLAISTWQAVRARQAERQAELERARAEDLLKFMLGDLYTQLDKVGRLDVLDSVADKATAYFGSLSPVEFSDTTQFSRAMALRLLGGVRMSETRYADAEKAFLGAYERASELAARHPRDGDILFERGQSEFGVGYVHLKRAEFAAANEWFMRYRGTCEALVALDPSRAAWQHELADSQQNLATLREQRGELEEARAEFASEVATLDRMISSDPSNLQLRLDKANATARVGSIAMRQGEFGDALKEYSSQVAELRFIAKADPSTAYWRQDLAIALLDEMMIEAANGNYPAANQSLQQAQTLLDGLVAHDAANAEWKGNMLVARLAGVTMARQRGDIEGASQVLAGALPQIEAIAASEPTDSMFAWLKLHGWRLKAQVELTAGRADAAACAATAVADGERLLQTDGGDVADLGECAWAYLVSGEIAAKSGDAQGAERAWQRAAALLAPLLQGSRDWRILDPAARAAAYLGREAQARALTDQLTHLGFVPLDPWPDPDRHAVAKISEQQPK